MRLYCQAVLPWRCTAVQQCIETIDTGLMASKGVTEFMIVLGQARLKGAVQMIVNPVVIWEGRGAVLWDS